MLKALFSSTQPETREIELDDIGWSVPTGSSSWAGETVTMATALQLLTVYGCVRMIADGISTLPIDVFRRDSAGSVTKLATPAWLQQPTTELDSIAWRTQLLVSLLLDGNAYVHIPSWTDGGFPLELIPLDPTAVTIVLRGKQRVYVVNGVERDDIVHVKGIMWPGKDKGMSPLESARQAIGLGIAATRYGAESFGSGEVSMPGVIEIPGKATGATMRETARLWQARRRDGGRGMPGVLQDGATWKSTGVTMQQSQFLGTRKFSSSEIAGQLFLVDPSDLGINEGGASITYANLEQRNARRVQVTFLPWIVRLETMISALLPRGQYCKLNVSALLRGDLSARWAAYNIAETINTSAAARGDAPVMSTQEMRDLEEMGPSPEAPTPPEPPAAPAPPVQEDSDERWIRRMADLRPVPQPAPTINVTVPDRQVSLTIPEARIPDTYVTVQPSQPPEVTVVNQVETPEVRVDVQQAPAPDVVVTPMIHVDAQRPLTRHQVKRDADGNIVEVVESEQ